MPTAAKLFASFGMALVAFFAAQIFMQHAPEGKQFGYFSIVSAAIGLVCGWRFLGPDAGLGWWPSANAGLKAAVVTLLAALLIFSTEEMLVLAFRKTYDGPMDAIIGVLALSVDFIHQMFVLDMLIILFGGGILAGFLSEWAARRWP